MGAEGFPSRGMYEALELKERRHAQRWGSSAWPVCVVHWPRRQKVEERTGLEPDGENDL